MAVANGIDIGTAISGNVLERVEKLKKSERGKLIVTNVNQQMVLASASASSFLQDLLAAADIVWMHIDLLPAYIKLRWFGPGYDALLESERVQRINHMQEQGRVLDELRSDGSIEMQDTPTHLEIEGATPWTTSLMRPNATAAGRTTSDDDTSALDTPISIHDADPQLAGGSHCEQPHGTVATGDPPNINARDATTLDGNSKMQEVLTSAPAKPPTATASFVRLSEQSPHGVVTAVQQSVELANASQGPATPPKDIPNLHGEESGVRTATSSDIHNPPQDDRETPDHESVPSQTASNSGRLSTQKRARSADSADQTSQHAKKPRTTRRQNGRLQQEYRVGDTQNCAGIRADGFDCTRSRLYQEDDHAKRWFCCVAHRKQWDDGVEMPR